MQHCRIYVRLKNGDQATGRELHNGPPPDHSTVLEVPLFSSRTVKARIVVLKVRNGCDRRVLASLPLKDVPPDRVLAPHARSGLVTA